MPLWLRQRLEVERVARRRADGGGVLTSIRLAHSSSVVLIDSPTTKRVGCALKNSIHLGDPTIAFFVRIRIRKRRSFKHHPQCCLGGIVVDCVGRNPSVNIENTKICLHPRCYRVGRVFFRGSTGFRARCTSGGGRRMASKPRLVAVPRIRQTACGGCVSIHRRSSFSICTRNRRERISLT